MNIRATVLLLLFAGNWFCSAQSRPRLEEVHQQDIRNNPAGIGLTISVVDNPSAEYHIGKDIRLKLSFRSTKLHTYTAELKDGYNVAAVSDEFVFQPEDGSGSVVVLPNKQGIVCCDAKRVYLTKDIVTGQTVFWLYPSLFNRRPGFGVDGSWGKEPLLHPGKYKMFVRTRRVMRGEPKPSKRYYEASEFQVTSSNILNVMILPSEPSPSERR